jgi:hypothetical protein
VWTWRGLVTFYTLFVIELATRRVQIVGCTPHPDEAFMSQAGRTMTATDEGALAGCRVLICDRDQKWSAPLRHMLEESKARVVQTPFQAPNCNAHAERFVRSIKEECLNRVIPMRGAAFPEGYARVRRALPPRPQSSGPQPRAHRRSLVSRGRQQDWPSSATRRPTQLLLPRGMKGSGRWLGPVLGYYGPSTPRNVDRPHSK